MTRDLLLMQREISKGNEKAFADLYSLFYHKLFHFATVITRSPEVSEELVEDVFVKLWSNRINVLGIKNLAVYLYVAVKNKSLNAVAKKAQAFIQSPFDDVEIDISHSIDPYNMLVTAEMLEKMRQAIENLPPRCKMIFKLVREDGLKYREVAEILNISVNTIDVQMAIAVKKICAAMQRAGIKIYSDKNSLKKGQ